MVRVDVRQKLVLELFFFLSRYVEEYFESGKIGISLNHGLRLLPLNGDQFLDGAEKCLDELVLFRTIANVRNSRVGRSSIFSCGTGHIHFLRP